MRALATGVVVALVAVVSLLAQGGPAGEGEAGAPFWEMRPFEEWTAAEVLQVLSDSPWTRAATLVEPGVDVRLGKLRYFVQWYSARTVREALVRMRQLQGRANLETDAEFLARPRDRVEIYFFAGFFTGEGGIRTVPLEVLQGMTREELRRSAVLMLSEASEPLHPDQVQFVRDADTNRLRGVVLSFDRSQGTSALQGEARVVCPTKRGSLSGSFLLGEMQRAGQPDL
ncbi:MAG: hypothetical protein ACE5IP_03885 [Terriglobia bacterium]